MTDITDTFKDNNERVRAIIASTEKLVATLGPKVRERVSTDNSRAAALALFKALGWEN